MPITFSYVRDLTEEDLYNKGTTQLQTKAPPLQELRIQHHSIAKMLVQGHKPGTIAAILGIGAGRISILQADASFQELLAYYQDLSRKEFEFAEADMAKMLHSLGVDSISILHEKLLDHPEAFDVKALTSIITLSADRSGHGPTATVNANVVHSLDGETLARIRGTTEGAEGPPPALDPEDRASLLRLAVRSTEVHPEGEVIEGEFSGGSRPSLREESGGDAGSEVAGPAQNSTVVDLHGEGEP